MGMYPSHFNNIRQRFRDGPATGSTLNTLAASGGVIPNTLVSLSLPLTSSVPGWAHPGASITNIRPIWVGYALDSTFACTAIASSYQISASIEYPYGSGTFYPLTFGGASTGTVPVAGRLTADALSGLTIPAGQKFGVRTQLVSLPSDKNVPCITLPALPYNLGTTHCNSATATTTSGSMAPTSSSTTLNFMGPILIGGDVAMSNAPCMALFGDSITTGFNETTGCGANESLGFWERGFTETIPSFKWTRPGYCAYQAVTSDTLAKIGNLLNNINMNRPNAYANIALGINDISQGANRTSSQILADRATLAATLPSSMRKFGATLPPRTSSTDGYATVANQTLKTDGTMSTAWQPTNTAILSGESWAYGVMDACSWAESGGGAPTNVWGAPFTPQAPTGDGTHPSTTKHAAMAALAKSRLQSFFPL